MEKRKISNSVLRNPKKIKLEEKSKSIINPKEHFSLVEENVGIRVYLTKTEGFHGVLKSRFLINENNIKINRRIYRK